MNSYLRRVFAFRGSFLQLSKNSYTRTSYTTHLPQVRTFTRIPHSLLPGAQILDNNSRVRFITTTGASDKQKSLFESLIGADRIPRNQEIHLYGLEDQDMGIMTKGKAEDLAKEHNCNIVLVKNGGPDFAVYYLMSPQRLANEKKQLIKKDKELIIKSKITDHDLRVKVSSMRQMLRKGHKVKVTIKNVNKENDVALVSVFKKIIEASKEDSTMKEGKKGSDEMIFTLVPLVKEKPAPPGPSHEPFTPDELRQKASK